MTAPGATALTGPTSPRASFVAAATVYYALAGGIALVVAGAAVAGAVDAASHGCQLLFSQADFAAPPGDGSGGLPPSETESCQQYVDLIGLAVAAVIGTLLLATAVAVYRRRVPLALGLAGAAAGIFVAAQPLLLVVWAMGFYRITLGPVEVLVGVLPLLAGLGAAAVVVQMLRAARARSASGA